MSKFIKLILILLIGIIVFNKKIVSYYYVNKFSRWIERPVLIDNVNFNYSGLIEIKKIQVLNINKFYYKNIFEAEKITLNVDLRSIFSDLIIIKNVDITNPKFFLDIKIVEKTENLNEQEKKLPSYEDNIGLAQKINQDTPDKIWPKKSRDINFLILKSEISGAQAKVKVSSISEPAKINLSHMKFGNFGNKKNYQHYKDVLKLILFDIFARTKDVKIKKILKEIYNS